MTRSSNSTPAVQEDQHALNDINDEVSPPQSTPPRTSEQAKPTQERLPWYLQVQQPVLQQQTPLSDRQKLPDLPSNPPPLLQPILNHISIDLGLDDLTLLDLRHLDPPPALGSNLIMLLGTARSEKHLHVSADRLCRWLRTEYKMRPFADGLLGRNELKLKMRRKAKRSKLLGAVGAKLTGEGEVDDGIRTGWVCVNIGRVEGGEVSGERGGAGRRKEGVVGFGTGVEAAGCSVVVQMMTEEKREEVDLEKLWGDIVRKAEREKVKMLEGRAGGDQGAAMEGSREQRTNQQDVASQLQQDANAMNARFQPTAAVSNPGSSLQARAYSTSARRRQTTATASLKSSTQPLPPTTTPELNHAASTSDPSITKLTQLLFDLKAMPRKQALEALGDNLLDASQQQPPLRPSHSSPLASENPPNNEKDTTFLQRFYTTMPDFPSEQHWHLHVALLAHARRLDHRDLHSPVLLAQLQNMQLSGLIPEQRTFKLVIQSMLQPLGRRGAYDGQARMPSEAKLRDVLAVMEDMEGCGYDAVEGDVLEMLCNACIGMPQDSASSSRLRMDSLGSVTAALQIARLRRHIFTSDWEAFQRTWRSYPQRFLPRSAGMYVVLFEAIAQGKLREMVDAKEVREVVRTALEEMEMEEPEMRVEEDEELATAVKMALEAVEPGLREEKTGGGCREWRGVYERCLRAVKAGGAADLESTPG